MSRSIETYEWEWYKRSRVGRHNEMRSQLMVVRASNKSTIDETFSVKKILERSWEYRWCLLYFHWFQTYPVDLSDTLLCKSSQIVTYAVGRERWTRPKSNQCVPTSSPLENLRPSEGDRWMENEIGGHVYSTERPRTDIGLQQDLYYYILMSSTSTSLSPRGIGSSDLHIIHVHAPSIDGLSEWE